MSIELVKSRIPQREPFLFIDRMISQNGKDIETEYHVRGDEDFFKGHFPERPILPGVIIQEALFQSGALLMSYIREGLSSEEKNKIGVVTRVNQAKFRQLVEPGQVLLMRVSLEDEMAGAFIFKGRTYVNDKVVAAVDFTCALA